MRELLLEDAFGSFSVFVHAGHGSSLAGGSCSCLRAFDPGPAPDFFGLPGYHPYTVGGKGVWAGTLPMITLSIMARCFKNPVVCRVMSSWLLRPV